MNTSVSLAAIPTTSGSSVLNRFGLLDFSGCVFRAFDFGFEEVGIYGPDHFAVVSKKETSFSINLIQKSRICYLEYDSPESLAIGLTELFEGNQNNWVILERPYSRKLGSVE